MTPTSGGDDTSAGLGDPRVVFECDADGVILAVEGPLHDWFDCTAAAVLGRSVVSFVHPHNRDLTASLVSILAGKSHLDLREELRISGLGDQWSWVEATISGQDAGQERVLMTIRPLSGTDAHRLDRRLQRDETTAESERRFRVLAETAPIGVFQQAPDGSFYVNRRWEEITGLVAVEAAGGAWTKLLHPDDAEQILRGYDRARRQGEDLAPVRFRIVRHDGALRWIEMAWSSTLDDHGDPAGMVGTLADVTDAVVAVTRSNQLTHALEATPDLVAIWDLVEGTVLLNDAGRRFLGKDGAVGLADVLALVPAEIIDQWESVILPEMQRSGSWRGDIELPDETGRPVALSAVYLPRVAPDGALLGVSAICRDITEFKQLEADLDHQASHDPLTGLPNRTLLQERLATALRRARSDERVVGVLFLDLDRFKVVNDSLGHALGDQVLVALASRLEAVLRSGETVARFGGDEFVVVAEDLPNAAAAERLAERLTRVAGEPVDVEDRRFVVSVSIGVATSCGRTDDDPDGLIRDADTAMYRAKARGGSRHELFGPGTRAEAVARLELESGLRRAIELDELEIHFQPTVDLTSGQMVGVEALVRWAHPTRGLLLPGEFLDVAAESNLMPALGEWVIDRAFATLSRLDADRPESRPPLRLHLNLSAEELADPHIVATVVSAGKRHGIDPAWVDLELTEHTLMEEVGATGEALVALSELGYGIAIDDFGTGYSSLAYIRQFPVDMLKIDRTFVAGITHRPDDRAIITAVLALASALGISVIAEGVEHVDQLAVLRELGCDMAQGYGLARPLPVDAVIDLRVSEPTW